MPELTSLSLEDLLKTELQTVALHSQSAVSAPGAVTVITAEQIRKYGYRTFAEALSYVRGFYLTDDYFDDSSEEIVGRLRLGELAK